MHQLPSQLEKDRERKREKKRESVVTFLSTSMLRAWNASTASASASAGGQGQDQDQGTEAVGSSAAATPSIPPEMKQGFAKLVAKMKVSYVLEQTQTIIADGGKSFFSVRTVRESKW